MSSNVVQLNRSNKQSGDFDSIAAKNQANKERLARERAALNLRLAKELGLVKK